MKNGRFKHLTLMSFIIVLIIVIADTAICARKDMNRKSQKAASVISSQKNGEDGKDKSGDTAETTKKDNSQSIINISGNNIRTRFKTPKGYKRNISKKSFGEFLEKYPLFKDGKKISLYNGKLSHRQDAHAAVLKMKLTDGNLQQCADSVIRLYAEYYYKQKKYDRIKFHLTNGFEVGFSKWSQGMRVKVDGNKTYWVHSEKADSSYKIFDSYLKFVFTYAGTLSMVQESKKISEKDIQPGDIFIYGGSPGHVEMVVDVCENKDSDKAFLLGQGYMPAQQFHILRNPADENDPWYYVSKISYPFETAGVTFKKGTLMRPDY